MPVFNLYRNCSYYWAFGAYISWFINHPLYSPPDVTRTIVLLTAGFCCELANLKCESFVLYLIHQEHPVTCSDIA